MKIFLYFPLLCCSLLFNGYAQDNNELSYRFASKDEARQLIAKKNLSFKSTIYSDKSNFVEVKY